MSSGSTEGKLGTFAGAFTPSILTILGIILFLRLGYVVGSAGLCRALLMIALANTISILTTVSLSAIATNLKDPGKSLSLGTFVAVGLSALVYLTVAFLFAGTLPNEVLGQDYASMKRVASIGFIIDAGVIAAALDAFSKAKKKLEKAEQEATEAHEYAAKTLKELEEAASAGVDEKVRSEIEAAALDVMELADRAARRQAEALAGMEDATKKVEAVGAPLKRTAMPPKKKERTRRRTAKSPRSLEGPRSLNRMHASPHLISVEALPGIPPLQ